MTETDRIRVSDLRESTKGRTGHAFIRETDLSALLDAVEAAYEYLTFSARGPVLYRALSRFDFGPRAASEVRILTP